MQCPFCNAQTTRVLETRTTPDGKVRRRRECLLCRERFTTYEVVELSLPRVIKQDGRRELFDEKKLRGGLLRALHKRPVGTDEVEAVVMRIKRRLLQSGEREVPSERIGEWVMEELERLDRIAYIRFASVYRSFEDVGDFRRMLDHLEEH